MTRARAGLLIVSALVALFAAGVTAENRARYLGLRSTFPPDLGCFHNQAFNLAQGRDVTYLRMGAWFKPGDFDGPSVYRSAHFSPLRVQLLPQLYRLWPRMETAMLLQALLVGSGAFGLYAFALARCGSPACGLVLAASFLLHPGVLNTAANDLREITLGIGPALLALWLHATGRWKGFAAAALLMLAARSEYVLLLAGFGLLNLRAARGHSWRLRFGLPLALALGWALLAEAYYRYFYGVGWPLVAFAGGEPLPSAVLRLLSRLLPFCELMLLPAVAALGAPEALALAVPFVALARRVHPLEFPPHHLQHLAPAMVAVFWGFALTLTSLWNGPLQKRRAWLLGVPALATLVGAGLFVRGSGRAYPHDLAEVAPLAQWADRMPKDATVVVHRSLVARFSAHTRVLDFTNLPFVALTPEQEDAALTAILASADLVASPEGHGIEERVARSGAFEPAQRFRRYQVFVRRRDAPAVAQPDEVLQQALGWPGLTPPQRRGATLRVSAAVASPRPGR